MSELPGFVTALLQFWPATLTVAIFAAAVWLNNRLLGSRDGTGTGNKFRRQLISFLLVNIGLIALLVVLPVSEQLRGQLLGLVGIVVSAALALSSTTVLGNMMAGAMLRLIRSYRVGDFLSVADRFGRVSEMGLLHTEIQTEDRDLVTLPNLYLVNNAYRVLRTSGTIVSATCSIGYDTHHARVEEQLLEAAERAGLQEPYVHVMELNDYSVTYRVAGLLTEVKQLLSTRSRLRAAMLDALHEANIEIMSPLIQAQRPVAGDVRMIPRGKSDLTGVAVPEARPEEIAFDKAEAAEAREELKIEHAALVKYIEELQAELKQAGDDAAKSVLEHRIQHASARAEHLLARVELGEAGTG